MILTLLMGKQAQRCEIASRSPIERQLCSLLYHQHPPPGFPGGSVVKNLPAKAGDVRDPGLIPGLGRSPGGGHGNPLQYSCLGNFMDSRAWQAIVHGVTKSRTRLKRQYTHTIPPTGK